MGEEGIYCSFCKNLVQRHISQSKNNPGRAYYACHNPFHPDRTFFRWADEMEAFQQPAEPKIETQPKIKIQHQIQIISENKEPKSQIIETIAFDEFVDQKDIHKVVEAIKGLSVKSEEPALK